MKPLDAFDRHVTALLADRQLLTHAFYQRWSAGELAAEELTSYAEQYRHFERALPGFLSATLAQPLPERARTLLAANLADETGTATGTPHLALFDRFADAVGADEVPATAATEKLVQAYEKATSPLDALGVLVAYESQAAAVAASKAAGLGAVRRQRVGRRLLERARRGRRGTPPVGVGSALRSGRRIRRSRLSGAAARRRCLVGVPRRTRGRSTRRRLTLPDPATFLRNLGPVGSNLLVEPRHGQSCAEGWG